MTNYKDSSEHKEPIGIWGLLFWIIALILSGYVFIPAFIDEIIRLSR